MSAWRFGAVAFARVHAVRAQPQQGSTHFDRADHRPTHLLRRRAACDEAKNLLRTGDHIYVKHGTPNSWADGTYTVFGQDSIDFDITLTEMDQTAHEATLLIRHVPPVQVQIQFPATWMVAPVGDHPNNWVEVEKTAQGKYSAEVGKETFEVAIRLSLPSGRILSAKNG